ncbi:hypothetical protein Salat_1141000 [Sesamum alatum]|uniref:Uncharacterized protein n=1 Tax=Sesamum alatum TaxID=300844 RepID=A0AAE1YE58_9LAMI|nr:hypothetical protein Salat_1141000 [Sesamum alatum]
MVLGDYADFFVWVDGVIEWIPTVRYVGGHKVKYPGVDKERLFYDNLITMYVEAGSKGSNVVIYDALPGETLDMSLKILEGDNGIRQLLKDYKGCRVISIYFEEKAGPLLSVDRDGNILNVVDPVPQLGYIPEWVVGAEGVDVNVTENVVGTEGGG